MRLIDADAARAKLQAAKDKAPEGSAEKAAMDTFMIFLDACPTIEAESVRRGRWENCKGKSALWHCSECGEKIIYNPSRKTYNIRKRGVAEVNKFCRACGARMDLEAEGENNILHADQ